MAHVSPSPVTRPSPSGDTTAEAPLARALLDGERGWLVSGDVSTCGKSCESQKSRRVAAAKGAPTLPAAIPAAKAARTAALACRVVRSAPAGVALGSLLLPSSEVAALSSLAARAAAAAASIVAPRPWLTLLLLLWVLVLLLCGVRSLLLGEEEPAAEEDDADADAEGEEGVTKRRRPTDGNRAVAGLSHDGSRGTEPSQLGTA